MVVGFRSRLIVVKYMKIPRDIYTLRCVFFETHIYIFEMKIKLNTFTDVSFKYEGYK